MCGRSEKVNFDSERVRRPGRARSTEGTELTWVLTGALWRARGDHRRGSQRR